MTLQLFCWRAAWLRVIGEGMSGIKHQGGKMMTVTSYNVYQETYHLSVNGLVLGTTEKMVASRVWGENITSVYMLFCGTV